MSARHRRTLSPTSSSSYCVSGHEDLIMVSCLKSFQEYFRWRPWEFPLVVMASAWNKIKHNVSATVTASRHTAIVATALLPHPPPPFFFLFFFPFLFYNRSKRTGAATATVPVTVSGPHSCWVSSRLTTHNESWPGAYKPLSNNRMITLFPTVICLLTGAFAGATYFSIENLAMHFAKNIFSQARFRTQHLPQPQSPLYDVTSTSQA